MDGEIPLRAGMTLEVLLFEIYFFTHQFLMKEERFMFNGGMTMGPSLADIARMMTAMALITVGGF